MFDHYAIIGPEDHNELPTFWSLRKWGWVEFHEATAFDARIIGSPLPIGGIGWLDVRTIDTTWTLITPVSLSWNRLGRHLILPGLKETKRI